MSQCHWIFVIATRHRSVLPPEPPDNICILCSSTEVLNKYQHTNIYAFVPCLLNFDLCFNTLIVLPSALEPPSPPLRHRHLAWIFASFLNTSSTTYRTFTYLSIVNRKQRFACPKVCSDILPPFAHLHVCTSDSSIHCIPDPWDFRAQLCSINISCLPQQVS